MPDRDPALEAALDEAKWAYESSIVQQIDAGGTVDRRKAVAEVFAIGEAHALRSLGAGTPEAQQALRELVQAAHGLRREHKTRRRCRALSMLDREARAFAALATPTEEGR